MKREYFSISDEFLIALFQNKNIFHVLQRFNVATTRAQALMIVVGNPDILQTDPCWRALIQYCIEQGGYKGERPKESVDENLNPNDILTINFSSLTIKTGEF